MKKIASSSEDSRDRNLAWPAAATLISAIVGAAATAFAWAVVPGDETSARHRDEFVLNREIGEVKARLTAIEESNRQMRTELRADIKDVRDLVRQLLKRP